MIVPARDAEATLGRTLEALARQDLEGSYEVIVVDDGSTDRTAEIAAAGRSLVELVQQEPRGPAVARNTGVEASTAAALAFCDADCFPTPGWLRQGLVALESADLVQGQVLPDRSTPVGPFDRTLWVTEEGGMYETANLFVRRETFDHVGGFEEWLRVEVGIAMFEDSWFAWRARRRGARTAFEPKAVVHHAVFCRSPAEYVAERRRLRYFPAVAARIPELRRRFFYRRAFLNRRSAALDAALAGTALAAARRSPFPLLAAAPYGRAVMRRARSFGRGWPLIAAVDVVADLVGLASLLRGSVRYRSPLF